MERPCKKYLWRHGGVFAQALNKLLKIAKHDKVIKHANKRVSTLPITVVTMPPDSKKQCNGATHRVSAAPTTPASTAPAPAATTPAAPASAAPTPAVPTPAAPICQDRVPAPGSPATATSQTTPAKRSPKDFIFGKAVGEGSFSTVYLAKDIHTSRDYAIKVCEKKHLIREKKTVHVKREKMVLNTLSESGAPFFVKLYCTFQDAERLYFVLTYAKNGELLAHINHAKRLSSECARFYAAELVIALEHLRSVNVIHRDLKPENILLDENMHILVTDFGSAKIVHSTNSETNPNEDQANGFEGTAQYISPELLKDKCTSFSADLWALGCILYQMLAGSPPFQSESEWIIFQKIQKLEYEFPEDFDPLAKDLVQKLLVLDPTVRLGASDIEGYPSLRSHPFFSGVNWETLSTTTPPPMHPHGSAKQPHSDHWVADHLEPGLDRGQLSRLLGLEPSTTPPAVEPRAPARKKSYVQGLTEEEISRRLQQQQAESRWHNLVEGNLILKQGLIEKRKLHSSLFAIARRRMLFLTLGPHLYYADPDSGTLKGEIRWTPELKLEPRTFKNFYLYCQDSRGQRVYNVEDPNSEALEWIRAIDEMHQTVFGQKASPS